MSCYKCLHCKGKTKVSYYIILREKQKYHITFFCEKNKSIILHSFARKTKVSYYIMFFQTLLKTFSCGLCYSDGRIILSYCEKRKINYYVCKKNNIFLSMNNKCHVRKSRNLYTVEEKQKYHITFFCEKNKSIILHHVLPNSPENVFLAAFTMLKLQQQRTNCQTKYKIIFQVKEEYIRFIWLS